MIVILPGVLMFSLMLAFNLPVLYEGAKITVASSLKTENSKTEPTRIRPFISLIMLCGGVFPAWFMTHDVVFVLFILLLGTAAYIDLITQWVPDIIIFTLSWVALCAVLPGGPDAIPALVSASMMLVPALTLNMTTTLRAQPAALASGDLYILPALGAWLTPEWAVICLATSIVLAVIVGRFIRDVPFVTVLYPVFVVVSLCGGW